MISYLRHMAIFAKVVDEGSFRAAAKEIGLAPSRVSETVSELEEFLGTTLLYRTTRKITLTNEGRIFYARVDEMLESAEAGLDELNAQTSQPTGILRISLPAFLTLGPLSTAIANFARAHPKVSLSVTYTDHPQSLLDDVRDLNIRVGWLDDSKMMSRKLATGKRYLVAGKNYVSKRKLPTLPKDLESWDWIHYSHRPLTMEFISPDGDVEKLTCNPQIQTDSIDAVNNFALLNMGATVLPSFLAERGIKSGYLVRLLPEWRLDDLGVYAVWPEKTRRQSLTLLFVRFLEDQGLCAPAKN